MQSINENVHVWSPYAWPPSNTIWKPHKKPSINHLVLQKQWATQFMNRNLFVRWAHAQPVPETLLDYRGVNAQCVSIVAFTQECIVDCSLSPECRHRRTTCEAIFRHTVLATQAIVNQSPSATNAWCAAAHKTGPCSLDDHMLNLFQTNCQAMVKSSHTVRLSWIHRTCTIDCHMAFEMDCTMHSANENDNIWSQ